jgi:RNA polymerase sigma factor (TIGR02999 family)
LLVDSQPEALTDRVHQWLAGSEPQDATLVEAVYSALHRLARSALARESGTHTLQPTALVNETYLELAGHGGDFRDRRHFFATAALCMRHILVDHARRKHAGKRGSGLRVEWNDLVLEQAAEHRDVDLLALDQALDQLQALDARRAQVIQLAYFAGLKREEIAQTLAASVRTVDRELRLGEAFLAEALA